MEPQDRIWTGIATPGIELAIAIALALAPGGRPTRQIRHGRWSR